MADDIRDQLERQVAALLKSLGQTQPPKCQRCRHNWVLCADDTLCQFCLHVESESRQRAEDPLVATYGPFTWTRAESHTVIGVPDRLRGAIAALTADGPHCGKVAAATQQIEPLTAAPYLYREFAELTGRSDEWMAFLKAITRFANTYGLLGIRSLVPDHPPIESAEEWATEAFSVWRVLQAWNILNGQDESEVEEVILWKVTGSGPRRRRGLADMIAGEMAEAIKRHQLLLRVEIRDMVTLDLEQTYEPRTLIGAIWTQTINAVTYGLDYVRCGNPRCGKWIKRSTDKRGPKSNFCPGANCRAAVDQRNVATAKRLAREKVAIPKIADCTGLNKERVKRIVEHERKKLKKGAR